MNPIYTRLRRRGQPLVAALVTLLTTVGMSALGPSALSTAAHATDITQAQAPAQVQAPAQKPPVPVSWLAAGDSYSSGEGIPGTGGPNDLCARSQRAYGPKAASILRKTRDWTIRPFTFPACTGAVIADFYHPNLAKKEPSQHKAAQRTSGGRYNIVSMSFGGNDVKFAETVKSCLRLTKYKSFGDALNGIENVGCATNDAELTKRVQDLGSGTSPDRPGVAYAPGGKRPDLAGFYARIAKDHLRPGGVLVVVGYPRLFAPSKQWAPWRGGRCQHLTADDADMLGRAAETLNAALKAAVSKARSQLGNTKKITYVDRLREFDNDGKSHSLCGNDTEWLTGLVFVSRNGEIRIDRSFHPNEVGHQVTAEDVAGYVDAKLTVPQTTAPTEEPEISAPDPGPVLEETAEPDPITDGGQRFGIGDEFSAFCSVAWPTAPTFTSNSIIMTMHCPEVPQQFLFVQVTYPDPGLPINPSTGRVLVHGQVVDFAKSSYGYQQLIVTADHIDLNP